MTEDFRVLGFTPSHPQFKETSTQNVSLNLRSLYLSPNPLNALVHENPPKLEETHLETWQKESLHLAKADPLPVESTYLSLNFYYTNLQLGTYSTASSTVNEKLLTEEWTLINAFLSPQYLKNLKLASNSRSSKTNTFITGNFQADPISNALNTGKKKAGVRTFSEVSCYFESARRVETMGDNMKIKVCRKYNGVVKIVHMNQETLRRENCLL
ncbi:hypothetical protein WN51_14682 [Melipona quadrifasciata]|uniref:Uncharacterized protein n=1 Tax=Melipona quadrifasciata TaxID=166423 RepID=A0A0N1ITG8_9HYME|nr:hypothetical protein WN51_14682 [Melipona quadrifasciata]